MDCTPVTVITSPPATIRMVVRSVVLVAIAFFMAGRKLAVVRWLTAGATFSGGAVGVLTGVDVGVLPVPPVAVVSAFFSAPHAAAPKISGRVAAVATTRVRSLTVCFPPQ
ncbi:hypothetical protein GCM10009789_20500 [Kribbella sancticallisti]|uniref:Secreted protein n=1 Tax=Kribbella sancticallisti TaxID=460087 RepID=A0ABP4NXM4_9ACTN